VATAAEDQFQARCRFGVVVLDVDGEEGDGTGALSTVRGAVAYPQLPSPGVEGGFGQAVAPAESTYRQTAGLPAFDELPPVLLLVGIATNAFGHGQGLQDTGNEYRALKVTTDARMGPTGRLPFCDQWVTFKSPLSKKIMLTRMRPTREA
jgi:hypothetical protein